ncbi:sigma-70 family RNA polymerase sigma factor [Radicibacter daui]|uniref:sigma-70 family RNA polymerase sigma factor n=1 Tax=Radicibacter daui TaxID=3064829 RepID=UPI004046BFAA
MEPSRNAVLNGSVELMPALKAFAFSLTRDPASAEDLCQETMLKVIRSLDKFEPGTCLKSWMFTIMRNTFRNDMKRKWRENNNNYDTLIATQQAPGQQEDSLRLHETADALDRLSSKHREVIVLIGALGVSYEDAAGIAGCAVGTIKSRLWRARQHLESMVDGKTPLSPRH